MKQAIVKSFLQFVNENEEPVKLNTQPFLIELADRIRAIDKFQTVSVEGTYIEITTSENIHEREDIEDASGDHIRVYADYTAKVMPILSDQIDLDPNDLNQLLQHGLADVTQFIKGFAISTELNCWSKDLNGWTMDDGSDEMEEHSLEDLNISAGSSIATIAEELTDSIDDWFNQFYTAGDVIQDSVNDYCNQYSDDDEDDFDETEEN